jgi:AcrR family transcriptional regulator
VRPREHSHADFVEAAIKIVDEKGLDNLTLRRLGDEVGVSYTAVYTYFGSRDALISALVDRVSTEVIEGIGELDGTPRDQLVSIASSVRRSLNLHPRLAQVFVAATNSSVGGNTLTRSAVAILQTAGLSGSRLAVAYRTLESYVFGASVFDLGSAPLHLEIRRNRYKDLDLAEFAPFSASEELMKSHNDEAFIEGFELLLTGLGLVSTEKQ